MSTPPRGHIAGRDSQLRAADADRERVAQQLQTGHAEGRLDLTEFQERLGLCYEAKTFGELGALVSDLPHRPEPAERHPQRRHGPRPHLLLPVIALCFILIAASSAAFSHGHGHPPPFFLIVPIVFLIWRFASMRRRRWA